jgi:hypothetical protein
MADSVNLDWLRTLSTEQLQDYRGALSLDLAAASGRSRKYTKEFCTTRITAIDEVLGGRGVIVNEGGTKP